MYDVQLAMPFSFNSSLWMSDMWLQIKGTNATIWSAISFQRLRGNVPWRTRLMVCNLVGFVGWWLRKKAPCGPPVALSASPRLFGTLRLLCPVLVPAPPPVSEGPRYWWLYPGEWSVAVAWLSIYGIEYSLHFLLCWRWRSLSGMSHWVGAGAKLPAALEQWS